ncbi:hypothetical protein DRO61_06830 [Candidatus Bathyarchaeota archaeon]|nr:MAG: hypothetical protein DRO61_06830 [Candidatus Bathyarchaeota archaeon]
MNSACTDIYSPRKPFKRHVMISRRHISSLDLYQEESGECKLALTMVGPNVIVQQGGCEELGKMFQSVEECMRTSNKVCFLAEE